MEPIGDLALAEQTEQTIFRDLCTSVHAVICEVMEVRNIGEPLTIPGQNGLTLASDGVLLLPDGHVVEPYQLSNMELTELIVALSHLTRPA